MARKQTKISKTKPLVPSYEEMLHSFLFWKQAQGISKTTLIDYQSHITVSLNVTRIVGP